MPTINIEPISVLGIVGAELFKRSIRDLSLRCTTKRDFNRAMEREVLPAVRALFDDHVAHDVLCAAREVYGKRSQPQPKPLPVTATEYAEHVSSAHVPAAQAVRRL